MYLKDDYLAYYQFEETLNLDSDDAGETIHYYHEIAINPSLFLSLPEQMKENTYLISQIVRQNGLILEYLSDKQQDNVDIAYECFCQNKKAFEFISQRLKNDEAFLLKLIDRNSEYYFLMSEAQQEKPLFIEKALKRDSLVLGKMKEFIKQSEHYVQIAIHQNGLSLQFASKNFRENLDYIREALNYARGFESKFVKILPKKIQKEIPNNPTYDSILTTLEKKQLEASLNQDNQKHNKNLKI